MKDGKLDYDEELGYGDVVRHYTPDDFFSDFKMLVDK